MALSALVVTALAPSPSHARFETVLGLEVHAQLLTRTKLFCRCETSFGDPPNTHTCPVCLGLPGALPVLSREAVRFAVRTGLSLGCTIQETSIFARKNYFYPDLPKGYQISQYERPLATCGALEIDSPTRGRVSIRVNRVHVEEDAGKNLHGGDGLSVVDLNRAGTPLVEIVSEPDLRSAEEAVEYLKRLREALLHAGVNDGNLEQGSFRCDVNLSLRPAGSQALGTRVELKNLNSFKSVGDAVAVEAARQEGELRRGARVRQQTRGYDADARSTYVLRDKEGDAGYRYFPDPDLPPLVVAESLVAEIRAELPELPDARRARWVAELGLTPYAAGVLSAHPAVAAFFEEARRGQDPIKVANFIQTEVLRDVTTGGLEARLPVTAAQVAELVGLVGAGVISGKQAKEVYAIARDEGGAPAEIVRARGLAVMGDRAALQALARELVRDNEKQAAQYRAGKTGVLGYFVGRIMKETRGSADPAVVNEALLEALLEAPPEPRGA